MSLRNHFAIVLDCSGSMVAHASGAMEIYKRQVDEIRRSSQENRVSMWTFSGSRGMSFSAKVHEKFYGLRPYQTPDTVLQYSPAGGTPLFDAVVQAASRLQDNDRRNSKCVLVITDGEENESSKTPSDMTKLIRDLQAEDCWTFVFMVPPGGSQALRAFGIPAGNIREWTNAHAAARELEMGTQAFFDARASGQTRSTGYFTDLSQVTKSDISALPDMTSSVKVWTVDGETDIKSFVEKKNRGNFLIGNGYYQLTKPEKIQAYKDILISEKGSKKVYGDARKLLNLPQADVRVRPGNHANYDIFVQSTANNRKLVRGTKFVYRKR